jgi:negative regulator of sigma E activity
MPAITLSVPQETKEIMDSFSEINWSGFVRKAIIEKTKELEWKEEMLKKLKGEAAFEKETVELGRKLNKGIAKKMKTEGLL